MKRTVRYTITAGAYRITWYDQLGEAHTIDIETEGGATITVPLETQEISDITEIGSCNTKSD